MASITQNKSGSWKAAVRKKGVVEYRTFDYHEDAVAWAAEVETKISRRVHLDLASARETTLAEAMETYREHAKSLKSYSTERYRIKAWMRHKLGKKIIADITSEDIEAYRRERKAVSIADSTIRLELACLKAAWGFNEFNVPCPLTKATKLLKTAAKRDRRLSAIEERYLIAELENTKCSDSKRANKYISLVSRFAIESAARASEILNLRWEHVQFEKGLCKFLNTKNGKDRFVPLSPAAIECLKQARALNPAIKGQVFKTTLSAIKQSWSRAKRRAKEAYERDCLASSAPIDQNFMMDFRFHDCRHEAASRWSKDFNVFELKAITGHLDMRSLERYVNKSEDDAAEIAERMLKIQKN